LSYPYLFHQSVVLNQGYSIHLPTSKAALGCFLGAVVGDAAGGVLEFICQQVTPEEVEAAMNMCGGGVWKLSPGQITDDTD
jgi:ADP-ribosylglycohydrolase